MPTRVVLALAASAVLLAGCGSSGNGEADKSAEKIISDAKAAAVAADSVHVDGTIAGQGQAVMLDLRVKGSGGTGSISVMGTKVEVVRIDPALYFRAPAAFFAAVGGAQGKAIGDKLADKWVKTTVDNPQFAALGGLIDKEQLFSNAIGAKGKLAKKGKGTVRGKDAIKIGDAGAFLYVATTGKPYPLEVMGQESGGGTSAVYFENWNDPIDLTPPPGAVELSTLLPPSGG